MDATVGGSHASWLAPLGAAASADGDDEPPAAELPLACAAASARGSLCTTKWDPSRLHLEMDTISLTRA